MNISKEIKIPKDSKVITNDKYLIIFNPKNGFEIITGINGNPDPFVLDHPNLIDIGIMGHCKNSCKICYQGDKYEENMSLENYTMIMNQVSKYVNQVALGGRGDPNLHEDFENILKVTRENQIVPNFTTSGNGLTDQQIEIAKKYVGAIAVSDYDEDYTYSALNRLIQAEIKTNIHLVLSRENLSRAKNILQGNDVWNGKFDIKKLNAVIFLLFKPQGRGKDFSELSPTKDELLEFIDLIRTPKCNFKIGMDSCLCCQIDENVGLTKSEKIVMDTCEGSRYSCYITPSMLFKPCSFDHDDNGVSLKVTTIKDAWDNSKGFLQFRNKLINCPYKCPVDF